MLPVWILALVIAACGLWMLLRDTSRTVEPLSDERACRWDPVHNVMRCDFD
jgi:hypothetical protein